jgi:phosphoglycolate phosphatase-like HAD superfamily hydrolase
MTDKEQDFAAMLGEDVTDAPETEDEGTQEAEAQAEAPQEPETEVHSEDGSEAKAEQPEAPEPKAEEKQDDRPKMVPHAAMHQERMQRRAAEQRAQQYEKRVEQILERISAKQPQEEQNPLDKDPFDAIYSKVEKLDQRLSQQDEQARQQQDWQRWQQEYRTEFERYAKDDPSAVAAYNGVMNVWGTTASAMGGTQQDLAQYERNFVERAMQSGIHPAQAYINLAKQMGLSVEAPAQEQEGTNTPQPQQQANEKIQRIEEGQKAAKSLSKASGDAPRKTSIEDVLSMSDDEFSKLSDADFARLAGGM